MTEKYRGKRLYLLFVHYGEKPPEGKDPEKFLEYEETLVNDLKHLYRIICSDDEDSWQGYAFVFLDEGWVDLLIKDETNAEIEYRLGKIQGFLDGRLGKPANKWVKLVESHHLRSLSDTLRKVLADEELADKLAAYLAGDRRRLRYDAPKVVEAAIRIANIGRNTPLLRFDDDVIFYGCRLDAKDLPEDDRERLEKKRDEHIRFTRTQIKNLCEHYRRLSQIPEIGYFMFSGSYLPDASSKAFEDGTVVDSEDTRRESLNGFSVRSLQLADSAVSLERLQGHPDYQKLATRLSSDSRDFASAEGEIKQVLEEITITLDVSLSSRFLRSLFLYGGNPFLQAISGAGLCLSDGAILDLPPFSNMRDNILWIDDHLKYSLHHELKHFGFLQGTAQAARASGAWFKQERLGRGLEIQPREPSLWDVRWHIRKYMPRFIRGCIADSWLRASPLTKLRNRHWRPVFFESMINDVPGGGLYAEYFLDQVIKKDSDASDVIAEHLRGCALIRIEKLVDFFESFPGTFLSLFATGDGDYPYRGVFSELGFFPEIAPKGLAEALRVARERKPESPLLKMIDVEIDDFLEYIEVSRFWRHFLFSVRSLLNREDVTQIVGWLLPSEETLRDLVKESEEEILQTSAPPDLSTLYPPERVR